MLGSDGLGFESRVFGKCPERNKERHVIAVNYNNINRNNMAL